MANNDFLPFAGSGSPNVIDQTTYAALAARLTGFQSGTAQSAQLNKVWRQSSIMAAVLGQFIADQTGQGAIDDGTINALLANLKQAIPSAINAAGVNSQQKLNGVNSPNLLFNGSGEFGNAGWPSNVFVQGSDPLGDGPLFANAFPISGSTIADQSANIAIGGGVALTLSAEINALGVSAGHAYVSMEGFDSLGGSTGWFGNASAVNGTGWARYSVSGTTPAGTASVIVHRVADSSPKISASGLAFRRIKLEQGSLPSLYSQEASLAAGTAPQFENSPWPATTAFVRRAQGSFSAFKIISDSAPKLDGSAIGCLLYFNATQSVVCTLPSLASVPAGSTISLNSGMQNLTTTLTPAGKDVIYVFGKAGAVTPVLGSGDSAIAVSSGDAWNVIGGSVQLGQCSAFSSLLGSVGYQKLPGGLIVQWGISPLNTGNGDVVTLPITFPNAICRVVCSDQASGCNSVGWAPNGNSKSNFLGYGRAPGSASYSPTSFGYIATGY